ncbi:putative non-specific serine/threonine protein kinase [Helianthus annuus]|nr:putative non-specific serine/threonine protein kinase [Helianthus annuus]
MDMFSLGCVLFFCMNSGKHPFGDTPPERDTNVIDNKMNLSLLEHILEVGDLCSQLLNHDLELRYNITIVKFWIFFCLYMLHYNKRRQRSGLCNGILRVRLLDIRNRKFAITFLIKKISLIKTHGYLACKKANNLSTSCGLAIIFKLPHQCWNDIIGKEQIHILLCRHIQYPT